MSHGWEFALFGADLAQPSGNTKGVDERFHGARCLSRHILRFSSIGLDTKRPGDERLRVKSLWGEESHTWGNGDTGSDAVRHVPASANLVTEDMTQPHANVAQAEDR